MVPHGVEIAISHRDLADARELLFEDVVRSARRKGTGKMSALTT